MDAPEKQSYRGGCPGSITTERTPDAIITCEVSGRENIRAGEVNEVAGSTPVHYLRQRDLARGHSIRDRRTPDQTIFGGERGTELGERSHQADARLLFEQLMCYSTASRSLPTRALFALAHNAPVASPYAHFVQQSHLSISIPQTLVSPPVLRVLLCSFTTGFVTGLLPTPLSPTTSVPSPGS